MVKYYFFASNKDIHVEYFCDVIRSAYKNVYDIKILTSSTGYIVSDEFFYDYLESLIPVISSDIDNSYVILMSNNDSQFSRRALEKARQGRGAFVTTTADLLFNLALEGDFELASLAKKKFDLVPRQLMLTAEAFISCGLNASLAAKKLYIHRNTFAYRLNQFIEATELDIRDYHNAQFFNIVSKLLASGKVV
ncbi:MAG: PucR family transcriptional regulator [Bacteroidia bacterium]|nr:PucR family transcriptional regulator [Bacteroidia bacterium]